LSAQIDGKPQTERRGLRYFSYWHLREASQEWRKFMNWRKFMENARNVW
jgi:hypothetical protein